MTIQDKPNFEEREFTPSKFLKKVKGNIQYLQKKINEAGNPALSFDERREFLNEIEARVLQTDALIREGINDPMIPKALKGIKKALSQLRIESAKFVKIEDNLDSYGNKFKNEVRLRHLINALKFPGVVGPEPKGIKSEEMEAFLRKCAPNIFDEWEKLGKLFDESDIPFFQRAEVTAVLKSIEESIQNAFDSESFLELVPEDWLEEMDKKGVYLMVRSTGSEDSSISANAGGNRSVAYVAPNEKEFCAAVSDVVSSYFGQVSLQNRIDNGQNPFKEPLKLAVMAEELIGEPIGGEKNQAKVPISLVLFSNEPLYVGLEKYRIMRISGTFGHGEAVVESKGIASDTVLILSNEKDPQKLYVVYDNREKNTRLAPMRDIKTGKVKLKKITNDPSLVKKRVFDDEMIRRLFELGVAAETYFQDPATDMEMVIKDGKIHTVQARPVVREISLPSYIDLKRIPLENSPIEKSIKTTMVVPGKSSVVTIENPSQILIADSLQEVQDKSLYRKGQHKLVITAKEEPANSHPVVNFSGYGIPCLYTSDKESIKGLVKGLLPTHSLAVCVQSETVYLWNNGFGSVEDYSSKGYVSHPAKIAVSVSETATLPKTRMETKVPEDVKDLLFQIRTATTSEVALSKLEEVQEWINVKKVNLEKQIEEHPIAEKTIRPLKNVSDQLNKNIEKSFKRLQAAILDQEPKHLEMLFHAKVLENLLFNESTLEGAIGHYSVVSLDTHIAALDEQIAYQRELPNEAKFMTELMYGMQTPSPDVFQQWRTFLLALEKQADPNLVLSFKQLLGTLDKMGVMAQFMTLSFAKTVDLEDPVKTAGNILSLFPEGNEQIVNDLMERRESLQAMRGKLEDFADPKKFEKAFRQMQREMMQFPLYSSNQDWQKNPEIVRMMVLKTMNELVDLSDSAIKSMKGSSQLDEMEKAKLFKRMLTPYLQLLNGWVNTVSKVELNTKDNLSLYMETVHKKLEGIPENDPSQLNPSRGFSVSAAMFGSGALFERHYPSTLEDIFTLTHQNLLYCTSALLNQMLTNDLFPEQLQSAMAKVDQIGGGNVGKPVRIGIDVDEGKVIVHYNVPLRNHSSRFDLEYDGKSLQMHSLFLGQARQRWEIGREMANFFSKEFFPVDASSGEQELVYSMKIGKESDIELAFQLFREIAIHSLNQYSVTGFVELISNSRVDALIDEIMNEGGYPHFAMDLCKKYLKAHPDEITKKTLFSMIKSNDKLSSLAILKEISSHLGFEKSPVETTMIDCLEENENIYNLLSVAATSSEDEVAKTALTMCEKLLDKDEGVPFIEKLAGKMLENRPDESLKLFIKLFKKGKGLEEALKVAEKALKNPSLRFRENALKLYDVIVTSDFEKNKIYPKVQIAAESALTDSDYGVRQSALNLYIQLIDKDLEAFSQAALKVAQEALNDNIPEVRRTALGVYYQLVRKGGNIGDAEVEAAAANGMKDKDPNIRRVALDIYQSLLFQRRGCKAAEDVVINYWQGSDSDLRKSLLRICKGLVFNKKGYEVVKNAAKEGWQHSDIEVKKSVLELYETLVPNGEGMIDAEKAAAESFLYGLDPTRLFANLFAKGEGYEAAEECAKQAWETRNDKSMEFATKLYEELFKKEKGFQSADASLAKMLKYATSSTSHIYHDLFKELASRGKGSVSAKEALKLSKFTDVAMKHYFQLLKKGKVEEAAAGAAEALTSNNFEARNAAFDLFKSLFQYGEGYKEAEEAAKTALKNEDGKVRLKAIDLFIALVKNKEGIQEAKIAVEAALNDKDEEVRIAAQRLNTWLQ